MSHHVGHCTVAVASAAGHLAGRFEESTGDIEVIGFRNPRLVCQAACCGPLMLR
ncbi:hypothetical protein [Myxococcus sp. Y35]|uniref:hypothetical protein n=1 Tax=Pseudomyxococcus flavus TaxID=3115648 RepID=UPI003CEE9235